MYFLYIININHAEVRGKMKIEKSLEARISSVVLLYNA